MEVEHEYENIRFPITQPANSHCAEMGKLGKKPKPGPKPNYVAARVAELNLQQRINSSGSTSKLPVVTKLAQRRNSESTIQRLATDKSQESKNRDLITSNSDAQFQDICSSEDHLYDRAIRVDLETLRHISQDVTSAGVPSETSGPTPKSSSPLYAKPKKPDKEEPIYDEALPVICPEDEEPLYDEAIVVKAERLKTTTNSTGSGPEPLYEDPDEFFRHGPLVDAGPTVQFLDQDSSLYDEALPVNLLTIPRELNCNKPLI